MTNIPPDCDAARVRLVERLHGELPPAAAAPLAEHLAACAACRSEAGDLAASANLLADLDEPASAPDPALVLLRADRDRLHASRRRWRFAAAAACLAATVLCALLATGLHAEWGDGAVTIAWGEAVERSSGREEEGVGDVGADIVFSTPPPIPSHSPEELAELTARVDELDELTGLLTREVLAAGDRRDAELARLRVRVAGLLRESVEAEDRWALLARDVLANDALATSTRDAEF